MSSQNNKIVSYPEIKDSPTIIKMTVDKCKKFCEDIGLEYHEGFENRIVERIVTTEAVDRDGDIIRAKGVDNSQYRKEPVVLYAHDRYSPPVGKSVKEWIDTKIKGWKSWDLYFDNEIDTTGTSDLVYRFVKSGAMRGGSIGFLAIQVKWDHSDDERHELGLGKYGGEFLQVLKLEHSACSIPANQEALAVGLKSIDKKILDGTLKKEDLDLMEKQNLLDGNMIDVFYSVLGVDKEISFSSVMKEQSINLIVNIDSLTEKFIDVSNKINSLNKNIEDINKSFTEKVDSLIATSERATSAIERKSTDESIYDNEAIENILKVD